MFFLHFCLMIEGSRSGSVSLTNGSRWPKNIWILRIRIRFRIRNTGKYNELRPENLRKVKGSQYFFSPLRLVSRYRTVAILLNNLYNNIQKTKTKTQDITIKGTWRNFNKIQYCAWRIPSEHYFTFIYDNLQFPTYFRLQPVTYDTEQIYQMTQ